MLLVTSVDFTSSIKSCIHMQAHTRMTPKHTQVLVCKLLAHVYLMHYVQIQNQLWLSLRLKFIQAHPQLHQGSEVRELQDILHTLKVFKDHQENKLTKSHQDTGM